MTDLTTIPTETLERMRTKVRTVLYILIGLDIVAVAVLAYLVVNPDTRRTAAIMAPALLMPSLALVPVVTRLSAITKVLEARAKT
jgi:hypothetical protein